MISLTNPHCDRFLVVSVSGFIKNMIETEVKLRKPSDIVREKIVMKGHNGETIDPFRLHGVLFIGNTKDGEWNLEENYTQFRTSNLGVDADWLDKNCDEMTEDEVIEAYWAEVLDYIKEKMF